MSTLANCPFCGGSNIKLVDMCGWEAWCEDCGACAGCTTNGDANTREQMIAAWNKRAQPAGEAVAWHIGNADGSINKIGAIYIRRSLAEKHIASYEPGEIDARIVPLYAAPVPKRKPLEAFVTVAEWAQQDAAPPAAANQAGIPEGYVLAPVRITNAMIDAANNVPSGLAGSPPHWQHVWDALLTYAPHPTESHALGGDD